MLEVGDRVIVRDNSYSFKIDKEGLKRGLPGRCQGTVSPEYIIKFTDKKLPANKTLREDKDIYNDTVIENELGEVYLIRKKYLVEVGTDKYEEVIKIQSEPPENTWSEPLLMPYPER